MQQLLNKYKSYLQAPQVPKSQSNRFGTSASPSLVPKSQSNRFGTSASPSTSKSSGSELSDVKKFRTLSISTIKNYLSDTKHFLTYLKTSYQEQTIKPTHITSVTIKNYLEKLSKNCPQTTLKRRFSSLKRFTGFLCLTKLLNSDPIKHLNLNNTKKSTTTTKILDTFKSFLKSEGLSNSTIKNYASDINHYLLWANKNINLTDKHSQIR